jgi:hypothetical protein
MVSMPALRMRDGNPPQHLGEFSIMPRPEEEMPMIWHQAIGGDADAGLGLGFGENLLKGGVISRLVEERQPSHATVQDVIGKVSSSKARAAWHADLPPKTCDPVKEKTPDPFSFPSCECHDAFLWILMLRLAV